MTEEPQQLREGKENHFLMSLAEEGSAGIVFNKRSLARASLRIKTAAWEYAWPCCRYLWSSRGIVRHLSGGGGGGGRGAESETNAHHERRALRVVISGRNDVLMLKV